MTVTAAAIPATASQSSLRNRLIRIACPSGLSLFERPAAPGILHYFHVMRQTLIEDQQMAGREIRRTLRQVEPYMASDGLNRNLGSRFVLVHLSSRYPS
jgi:hypothetical protein